MLLLIACVAIALAEHHSGRRFDDLHRAEREADKLIGVAAQVLAENNVFVRDEHDDDDDRRHERRHDDHRDNRRYRTSSRDSERHLQEAFDERLVEVAIAQALKAAPAAPQVLKKPYQARFEITQFDGNDLPSQVFSFGPTVITTRRNEILYNTQPDDVMPFFTAADFLDADHNGQPDIIAALIKFRNTDNPDDYIRVLRTRAVKAVVRGPQGVRGTIDLINIIKLDGTFSVTNQLVSPCFSATSDPEFVFEAVVGAKPNQNVPLAANPTQTNDILLMGSTALNESDSTFNTANAITNVFYQNGAFVEAPPPMGLYLNLFDRFVPGPDVIAQQGRVFFGPCHQFNYFQ